ncbi:CPCC family cysteine-rich protein [Oscillospiraceae bacterium 38-13]
MTEKQTFYPGENQDQASEQRSTAEKFPCPCCGYNTFPAPPKDAVAYICPVCFWENDVFISGEDQPSDENRGITLKQAREAFRRLGAVRKDLIQYARKPLPDEIPERPEDQNLVLRRRNLSR